eukprot:bmy_10029T0
MVATLTITAARPQEHQHLTPRAGLRGFCTCISGVAPARGHAAQALQGPQTAGAPPRSPLGLPEGQRSEAREGWKWGVTPPSATPHTKFLLQRCGRVPSRMEECAGSAGQPGRGGVGG